MSRKQKATSSNIAEARAELKYKSRMEKLDVRSRKIEQQEKALDAIQAKLAAEATRVRIRLHGIAVYAAWR